MIITKIEKQKNDDSRYSIFIDDEFKFGLSGVDVLYYKLKEDEEITQERYDHIFYNVVVGKARDSALRMLGHSMRTEKELIKRLFEKDYSGEVIDEVIELLKKYSYIDDAKYAEAYVNECANRKLYGRHRIKYELTVRGIDSELAERILDEADINEIKNAKLLIEKKLRGHECDYKEKRKLLAYLQRYGYSYDVINDALRDYINDMEINCEDPYTC